MSRSGRQAGVVGPLPVHDRVYSFSPAGADGADRRALFVFVEHVDQEKQHLAGRLETPIGILPGETFQDAGLSHSKRPVPGTTRRLRNRTSLPAARVFLTSPRR